MSSLDDVRHREGVRETDRERKLCLNISVRWISSRLIVGVNKGNGPAGLQECSFPTYAQQRRFAKKNASNGCENLRHFW